MRLKSLHMHLIGVKHAYICIYNIGTGIRTSTSVIRDTI